MILKSFSKENSVNNSKIIWRITALWGFSEAALGGILHAFKIPFTGLFVGSAAAIFISLIAYFSSSNKSDFITSKGTILKATFTVLIIKGFVSPYTPVTAYFAVLLQGIVGEFLFNSKNHFKIKTIILSIFILTSSALQKIIILTIVFSNSLWESIDTFAKFIFNQFGSSYYHYDLNLSYIIIGLYLLMHLVMGIYIGIFAAGLPENLKYLSTRETGNIRSLYEIRNKKTEISISRHKNSKTWWKKKSGIIIFIFSLTMIILSYTYPEMDQNISLKIIVMLVRSIFIIFIWYKYLSPFLLKKLKYFLSKKAAISYNQVEEMINIFPQFKIVISNSWKQTSNLNGIKKINAFISNSIAAILFF